MISFRMSAKSMPKAYVSKNSISSNIRRKHQRIMKTTRLILNLFTYIMMTLTVIVTLVYASKATDGTNQLHIILCVIGVSLVHKF